MSLLTFSFLIVGPLNGLGIDHVEHLSMNMKDLSVGTTQVVPMQRKVKKK